MIFITSNRKSHLFKNFWTFKILKNTQNTEYNYIYVENYTYKNSNRLWKYIKRKQKNTAF